MVAGDTVRLLYFFFGLPCQPSGAVRLHATPFDCCADAVRPEHGRWLLKDWISGGTNFCDDQTRRGGPAARGRVYSPL